MAGALDGHHPNNRHTTWATIIFKPLAVTPAGFVYSWNAETGQDMLTLEGHTSAVAYLAWSPDGRMLASSNEAELLLWDATGGYEEGRE